MILRHLDYRRNCSLLFAGQFVSPCFAGKTITAGPDTGLKNDENHGIQCHRITSTMECLGIPMSILCATATQSSRCCRSVLY